MLENAKSITLNSEMVKAILSGNKTQIRRVVDDKISLSLVGNFEFNNLNKPEDIEYVKSDIIKRVKYRVGDILYVKETFGSQQRTRYGGVGEFLVFKADYLDTLYHEGRHTRNKSDEVKWESSTRMPKKYARIFLKVTNVRVEKIQDISNNDKYYFIYEFEKLKH